MNFLRSVAVAVAAVAAIGCQGPRHIVVQAPERAVTSGLTDDDDSVWWSATQDVLRRYRYRLDEVDRRAGRITTYPEGSQHFFEFWRHDAATRRDFWESTLNSIRRRVRVNFDRPSGGGSYRVNVEVRVQRLSAPDRQFNNSAAAYHFFSTSLPAVRTGVVVAPENRTWMDLGRDPAMERQIFESILAEVSRRRNGKGP